MQVRAWKVGKVAMATYEKKREAVMDSDNCDLFSAREVAYSWHSGQNSPLYSFASTDCTVWSEAHREDLITEVKRAIRLVQASPLDYYADWESVDQYTRENHQCGTPKADWGTPAEAGLESLDNLLRCIRALPAKE